jgi:hypothetical protein
MLFFQWACGKILILGLTGKIFLETGTPNYFSPTASDVVGRNSNGFEIVRWKSIIYFFM